jgi:L-lactate dehydrogenase complex protein LldF
MTKIPTRTRSALSDERLQKNLRGTLSKTLEGRRVAVAEVDNWEELRSHARQVKAHTLARLPYYLEQLESRVIEQGGKVFWAQTEKEATEFVVDLARTRGIRAAVKSKSMLGEEIHLNEALEAAHIEPIETDLGEYIVQLARQAPSHIVMPALHMSCSEVSELFTRKLGMAPTDDAEEITATARATLRQSFLKAHMGITGVNFGVAETGTIVIVENEGNARLSVAIPEIHVAIMGIEKVIPRQSDLSVFLKLLTRSATGQKISTYVNFVNGARRPGERDGPLEFYLVLVDNGRSRILEDNFLRQTLYCIRCGACLDICPVYQRIGGHAYGSTYQGPIGAILTPQLLGEAQAADHPFASSLCGACEQNCPVKIEIPHILLELRQRVQESRSGKAASLPLEKWAMQTWAWIASDPAWFARMGRLARRFQKPFFKLAARLPFPSPLKRWSEQRELPVLPERSFRELYRDASKEKTGQALKETSQ